MEEMTVYPLYKKELQNGESVADHSLDDHFELKRRAWKLDQMKVTDPSYDDKLHELMQVTSFCV
jgi:hypothetical protein